MPRTRTGPKKVRIPGTNRWVAEGSPEDPALADAFDESGWEADSDLGPRPAPAPAPVVDPSIPHYYHAYLPNLRIKRGRKDALKFVGGVIYPRTRDQEARVRKALAKYAPGRDVDRWKGDTPGLTEELRCPECGYFTRNQLVWKDHVKKTGHLDPANFR